MRVLVCGSRYLGESHRASVYQRLRDLRPSTVITGAALGADKIGAEWALQRDFCGVPTELLSFPADWKTHGRAAGPIRNQKMLDEAKPDLVLAFHTDPGLGKGTRDMVNRARAAGVPVEVVLL